MKKKFVLMSLMIVALICTFAVSAFATEFTVTTAGEFDDAYSQAQDGDTIIIKSDISAQFNFGKSITYILDGGVRWSAKGGYGTNMCDAPGKTVKVYARNGDGAFYPASGMWFNNTGTNTTNDLSSTTFSLGSLDNSKLTLDCSAFTASNSRMFYDATLKEFNLLSGVVVTNLNVIGSGSRYINASTVNMYDGAEICGNKMTNYTAIIFSDVFNMYGGKIYGNYLGCYGVAQSGKSIVFGGEVCNNYVTGAANGGVPSALFNAKSGSQNGYFEIYGGSINNNLLLTANAERQALLCAAGGSLITAGVYFDNYETADWGEEPTKVDGIYTSSYDVANASVSAIQGYYTTAEYSVIFKNSNGTVINAYMLKNGGNIVKAYDGSTEVTIPESQLGWTTKPNYCLTVTPSVDKQGTYYTAVNHACDEDDGDCTTPLICNACGKVFEADINSHKLQTEVKYENGYAKEGYKRNVCIMCNSFVANEEKVAPIFTCLGYSVGPDGYSLKAGFKVNITALEEYKGFYPSFSFGMIMANANTVASGNSFFVDGILNSSAKGVMVSVESLEYSIWNIDIGGFNADIADSLELVVGIYTKGEDGSIKVAQYIDADKYATTKTYSDMSLNAITFNQARVAHGMDALIAPNPSDEQ